MDEPTTAMPPTAVPEDGSPSPTELAGVMTDRFWELLDALVPDGCTRVTDASGVEHELPTALPARRQIGVLRYLRELWNLQTDGGGLEVLQAAFVGGNIAAGFGSLLEALEDERVFDCLDKAMMRAFGPDDFGHGALADLLADETKATDVFPIEEIVTALVPFFVTMLRRLGDAVKPMQAMMAETDRSTT